MTHRLDKNPVQNNPPAPVDFRRMVAEEMRRQSVAVTDLAVASGVNRWTLYKWLDGTIDSMSCDRLASILAVLRINVHPTMVKTTRQVVRPQTRGRRRRVIQLGRSSQTPRPSGDVLAD